MLECAPLGCNVAEGTLAGRARGLTSWAAPGFFLANGLIVLDEIVYFALLPLLPVYAQRFDLSQTGVGLMYAAYPLCSIVSSVPTGLLVDRLGARRLLIVGAAIFVLASAGFAAATTHQSLLAARGAQGLAAGITAVAGMALIAGTAAPERRATTLGLAVAVQGLSSFAGPVLGGFVVPSLGEEAFWLPAVLGVVVLAGLVVRRDIAAPAPVVAGWRRGLAEPLRSPDTRAAVSCILGIAIAGSAVQTLAPLDFADGGGGTRALGAVLLTGAAVGLLLPAFVGRLADRRGLVRVTRAWAAVVLVLLATLAVGHAVLGVVAAVVVLYVPQGRTGGILAYARSARSAGLGSGLAASMGLAVMAWSVGAGVAPVAVGAVADAAGSAAAYAACALAAGLLFVLPARESPAAPAQTGPATG